MSGNEVAVTFGRARGLVQKVIRYWDFYLYVSPFYILFAIFGAFPFLWATALSFTNWQGTPAWDIIGLENYVFLFRESVFVKSIGNVLYLWVGHLPLWLGSLVFAFLLDRKMVPLRSFLRTVSMFPYVTPIVVAVVFFGMALNPTFGLVNAALQTLGAEPVPWLNSPAWSKPAILIVIYWRWLGYTALIWLGGLQAIPDELYEAAEVDGATTWDKFWFITLPLLRPVGVFVIITSTIGALGMFEEPYLLTGGGPENSSMTMGLLAYDYAFSFYRFGVATAAAIVIGCFILVFSIVEVRLTGEH